MFHISFESGIILICLLHKSKKQENTMKFFTMLSFNKISLKMYLGLKCEWVKLQDYKLLLQCTTQ